MCQISFGRSARTPTAIARAPDLGEAYWRRGQLKGRRNDLPGARADLENAVRLSPDVEGVYVDRGNLRLRANDVDGALTDFQKAVELDGNDHRSYFGQYLVFQERNDSARAQVALAETLKRQPQYVPALLARAEFLKAQGDGNGAAAQLKIVIGQAIDDETRRRVDQLLDQVGGSTTTPPHESDYGAARVYVHFRDEQDRPTVDELVARLKRRGVPVKGAEQRNEATKGDVRWFHSDDGPVAGRIAAEIEQTLRELKRPVKLKVQQISYKRAKKEIPQGQLEVWLPPLGRAVAAQAQQQQQQVSPFDL